MPVATSTTVPPRVIPYTKPEPSSPSSADEFFGHDSKPQIAQPTTPKTPSTPNKSKTKTNTQTTTPKSRTKFKEGGGAEGNRGKGQPWSGSELKQLLHFALERGGRSWEDAVPGRTGSQASQTWKVTVLPYLEKALDDKSARGATR